LAGRDAARVQSIGAMNGGGVVAFLLTVATLVLRSRPGSLLLVLLAVLISRPHSAALQVASASPPRPGASLPALLEAVDAIAVRATSATTGIVKRAAVRGTFVRSCQRQLSIFALQSGLALTIS
jgi:hypothetical protein